MPEVDLPMDVPEGPGVAAADPGAGLYGLHITHLKVYTFEGLHTLKQVSSPCMTHFVLQACHSTENQIQFDSEKLLFARQ